MAAESGIGDWIYESGRSLGHLVSQSVSNLFGFSDVS